ncbi:MAG: hypothetical protein EPN93_07685 [Spirochaetes bacterium]|nr:MAG: hypothetical protein EPN93_07685 [Spirochaetota bacterium]
MKCSAASGDSIASSMAHASQGSISKPCCCSGEQSFCAGTGREIATISVVPAEKKFVISSQAQKFCALHGRENPFSTIGLMSMVPVRTIPASAPPLYLQYNAFIC